MEYKKPINEIFKDAVEISEPFEFKILNPRFKEQEFFITIEEPGEEIKRASKRILYGEAWVENPQGFKYLANSKFYDAQNITRDSFYWTPLSADERASKTRQLTADKKEVQARQENKGEYKPNYPDIGEGWKPLKNFEEVYHIATNGKIVIMPRRKKKVYQEKSTTKKNGRNFLNLALPGKNGKNQLFLQSEIIADHFHEKPLGSFSVDFHDGDQNNIHPDNLFWVLPEENKETSKLEFYEAGQNIIDQLFKREKMSLENFKNILRREFEIFGRKQIK